MKNPWLRPVVVACGFLAICGLLTENPLLTTAGFAVLPLLVALLARPGEPPVLLFAATFQWLQVFAPVLVADVAGVSVSLEGTMFPDMRPAAWLSLLAIVFLAVGMRVGAGATVVSNSEELNVLARDLDGRRLLLGYLIALALSMLLDVLALSVSAVRQQLQALSVMRWIAVFLILFAGVARPSLRPLAAGVVVVEILLGFGGFFSGFKYILFLTVIVLAGNQAASRRLLLQPAAAAVLVLALGLATLWQSVKADYREFLNQGTATQAVLVSPVERFSFLASRASRVTLDDLQAGFSSGFKRVGYLEFFAASMKQVPDRIPYQEGRLWGEAVSHVLMPRIFFPDKPSIDDSVRTNEFSGIRVAGAEQGTSISIGYVGESYIDFGPIFMFVPVFLVGLFWGWIYRWLANRSPYRLLGLAAATNVILGGAITFETSNIKLVGGALMSVIALTILLRYGGRAIWAFLINRTLTRDGAR